MFEGNITEERFVPAFTTPGMSEHAMSDFWWESSIDNKMIPDQNAIRPDDIQCDNLDYATLVHVEEHNHTRSVSTHLKARDCGNSTIQ